MQALLRELIPHAPQLGLYHAPDIPADKLRGALGDYAEGVRREEVLVLFDATLLGGARDGAVFTAEGFTFQNNDLETPQTVDYRDVVRVEEKRKLLGGHKVVFDVNRGRSTFQLTLDFSGKPEAAEYVARFLQEALLHREEPAIPTPGQTDVEAVHRSLQRLRDEGKLSASDHERLLAVLDTEE